MSKWWPWRKCPKTSKNEPEVINRSLEELLEDLQAARFGGDLQEWFCVVKKLHQQMLDLPAKAEQRLTVLKPELEALGKTLAEGGLSDEECRQKRFRVYEIESDIRCLDLSHFYPGLLGIISDVVVFASSYKDTSKLSPVDLEKLLGMRNRRHEDIMSKAIYMPKI
jgi:hypothetical protein